MRITVPGFSGVVRITAPQRLEDHQAQVAIDCDFRSGASLPRLTDSNRFSESPLHSPSTLNAPSDCVLRDANPALPLGVSKRFSTKGEVLIAPCVVVLDLPVCPSAVFRGIPIGWVNPIEGHLIWARTHVLKKILKRLVPSFADGYPFVEVEPSVSCPAFTTATLLHFGPSLVFAQLYAALCSSVFGASFVSEAPAGQRPPQVQNWRSNSMGIAAIASTHPHRLPRWGASIPSQGDKSAEPLASYIKSFHKNITSILVNNHWRARSNRVIEVLCSAAKPSYAGAF